MNNTPVVNQKRCTRCGRCAAICPKEVLALHADAIEIVREGCMQCAHCYAVCAFDAITFDRSISGPEFASFDYRETMVDPGTVKPGDVVNLFRSRRSVRRYQERPVPDAAIRDLIAFAVTAPSGSNCQLWEFTVLNGRGKIEVLAFAIGGFFRKLNRIAANPVTRILSVLFAGTSIIRYYRDHYASVAWGLEESEKGRDLLFHGAPALIIIHGKTNGSTPLEDAQYAGYNICMLAHALGMGTCFIGYAVEVLNRDATLRKKLEIPAGNRVLAALTLGYPAARFLKPAPRKSYAVQWL